jgi:hypothetical protein
MRAIDRMTKTTKTLDCPRIRGIVSADSFASIATIRQVETSGFDLDGSGDGVNAKGFESGHVPNGAGMGCDRGRLEPKRFLHRRAWMSRSGVRLAEAWLRPATLGLSRH